MKCIDGIEGVLREVITGFVGLYETDEVDAMTYIRFAKSLIESASAFVSANPEITTPAAFLQNVLYDDARNGFLDALGRKRDNDSEADGEPCCNPKEGYSEHFFDYAYRLDTYPD
ncbi:MAG: hypothetical protein HZB23_15970 [Deltaproteobacteria bacterium]|nr:hypothetical protein [Deltaproteobacteria bacterium]